MAVPAARILWTLVAWAPAVYRAARVWLTPAERDAQRRHEQIDRDAATRRKQLSTVPSARPR
jgi:hypothetical protein